MAEEKEKTPAELKADIDKEKKEALKLLGKVKGVDELKKLVDSVEKKSTKSARVDDIPLNPNIKMEDVWDPDQECIDPVAIDIIREAMDAALENAASRLASAGKFFSGVESSAYEEPYKVLPTIKTLRKLLDDVPVCEVSTIVYPKDSEPEIKEKGEPAQGKKKAGKPSSKKDEVSAPGVAKKISTPAKTPKKVLDIVKDMGEGLPKEAKKALAQAAPDIKDFIEKSKEALKAAEGNPEMIALVEKAIKARTAEINKGIEKSIPKPPQPKQVLQPTWGKAVFMGEGEEKSLNGVYDSPAELARKLGIKYKGGHGEVPDIFARAGFKVTDAKGGPPQRLADYSLPSQFYVKRVAPTDPKLMIPVEAENPDDPSEKKKPSSVGVSTGEVKSDWKVRSDTTGMEFSREKIQGDKVVEKEYRVHKTKVYFDDQGVALGPSIGYQEYKGEFDSSAFFEIPFGPEPIAGKTRDELLELQKRAKNKDWWKPGA